MAGGLCRVDDDSIGHGAGGSVGVGVGAAAHGGCYPPGSWAALGFGAGLGARDNPEAVDPTRVAGPDELFVEPAAGFLGHILAEFDDGAEARASSGALALCFVEGDGLGRAVNLKTGPDRPGPIMQSTVAGKTW